MNQRPHSDGSIHSYIAGFGCSILCTVLSFGLVASGFTGGAAAGLLVILALLQLIAQLIFFLHLGSGSSARWNIIVFSFAVLVVFIIVAGSLWIMANLNHNMSLQDMYIDGIVTPQTEN